MGQAKQRGTFEERKAEGMVLASVKEAERQRQAAIREAALTPTQRHQRHHMRAIMAMAAGMNTVNRTAILNHNPLALKHLEPE